MRRQVITLPDQAPVSTGINLLVKYKINALLTTDPEGSPAGVLSKTDLVGAWYAGLDLDTPVNYVMSSPPLFCGPGDSLESALALMKDRGVYRLFVTDPEEEKGISGLLAYPDIVGLLYRYCRSCDLSHALHRRTSRPDTLARYRVRDIMTPDITFVFADQSLSHVMEVLSA